MHKKLSNMSCYYILYINYSIINNIYLVLSAMYNNCKNKCDAFIMFMLPTMSDGILSIIYI